MTTIAADRTSLAGDSKVTHSGLVYGTDKIFRIRGTLVGVCGDVDYTNAWLDWYRAGCPEGAGSLGKKDFNALVVTRAGIELYTDRCSPDLLSNDRYAIGTGAMAALTAMHLGKTPTEAVEIACIINSADTGGPVKTLRLTTRRK